MNKKLYRVPDARRVAPQVKRRGAAHLLQVFAGDERIAEEGRSPETSVSLCDALHVALR